MKHIILAALAAIMAFGAASSADARKWDHGRHYGHRYQGYHRGYGYHRPYWRHRYYYRHGRRHWR